jgi:hypothetical protein
MQESGQPGIKEIFVIKTDQIEFFGVMVGHRRGRSAVQGGVRFPDGTRWSFQSPPGDHAEVKHRLVSLCHDMAACYHTDIFHLAFPRLVGYKKFTRVLWDAQRHVAYA